MKTEELRGRPSEDLVELIEITKESLFRLRFKAALEGLENPSEIGAQRRLIARAKTLLRKREIEAEAGDE